MVNPAAQSLIMLVLLALSLQVQAGSKKSQSKVKSVHPEYQEVCKYFAKLKKNKLLSDHIRSETSGLEDSELKDLIGAQAYKDLTESLGEDGAKYVTKADLNHDKITDYVIQTSEGTAHIGSVAVIVGKKDGKARFIESLSGEYGVTAGVLGRLEGDYLVVFEGDNEPTLSIIENHKLKKKCTP